MQDDGVERWLIRGELRENLETDMNRRSPDHGRTTINVGMFLKNWVRSQPHPRGNVYGGDTMFRLRPDRSTTVGIDVAYVDVTLEAGTPKGTKVIEGAPVLAVEVLSPSDKHEDITEKVEEYLAVGVAHVWVLDHDFEIVTVLRPNCEPTPLPRSQELSAEPELPGFRVRVAELFE
ncbi:MAG: Uma2 family endonuclease [Pirellulaceae bacterium]|nr:Uma2 family endonuclease [Pirellulaceae bacterium]